jgi:hypothetical protein
LGVAAAVGVFAGVQASKAQHSAVWLIAISALIIAVLTGVSFWVYWSVAPRLGRATTLAALSLGWGITVLLVGWLSTSGSESSSGNLAGYAISGVLIPWLVAGLTIPFAFLVRGVKRLVAYIKHRDERAAAKATKASVGARKSAAKKTGSHASGAKKQPGRYTAPKAGAKH